MAEYRSAGRPRLAIYVLFALGVLALALAVGTRWPAAFLAAAGVTLFMLVAWHARTSYYRCAICDLVFQLSMWGDFISPKMIGRKLVRCPQCGTREPRPVLKRVR